MAETVPMALSLPARYYNDTDYYRSELESFFFEMWIHAGRAAEIPNPGDYVTYEILGKSIIVLRIDETTVRAFHNACRHRGVQVVDEGNGNVLNSGDPLHQGASAIKSD